MITLAPKYDPRDPAVLDNPYPTYARLREAGRLCRGGPGQWVVTRYADVAALLHDPRLSHQFPAEYRQFSMGEGAASEFFARIILTREPPQHTHLRRLMTPAFSSTLIRRLDAYIESVVDELLQAALDRGSLDAVGDLAFPLPVMVVCELVGIPTGDRDEVRPRALDLSKGFSTHTLESDRAAVNAAVVWLREYVGRLTSERRARPRDDLLSLLVTAGEGADKLSDEDIVDNAVFLFFAGFETTMNLIATGCAALLDHPDALSQLRADPSLMPTAVDEILRYDAPIQNAARLVTEPVNIGGQTIRAGRVLILLLGSANHDERQFVDPERFEIGRKPNPHVSFGGGIHHCLGALLARLEGSVALSRLVQRCAVLEPAGPAVRRPSPGFRAYAAVPMRVTAA